MKNVLLVDNHTYYLKPLQRLINEAIVGCVLTTIKCDQIKTTDFNSYDLVVLSGGTGRAVIITRKFYRPIREMIMEAKVPVIGICLGAELIADAFGGEITKMRVKRYRNIPIYFVSKTKIDPGTNPIWVYQAHRWKIRRLPEMLEALAVSKDGIEVFRHRTKIIYGLQFHPEVIRPHGQGADIFVRVVKSIKLNTID